MNNDQKTYTPMITITIPCRNEEANCVGIAEAVVRQLERVGERFEIIFIDNASDDRTVELIRELCSRDQRIKLIINTRNYGQMRSPTHAIFQARGQAVIAMCADFQDPPELIPEFINRWRHGADIVLGVRLSEKSPPVLAMFRKLSYSLARKFSDYPIISNATGFGLFDRKVVGAIAEIKEPEPFFRGLLVETGYKIETVSYHRPPRAGGKTNNNFFALLDFAMSSLAGSSRRLLRVPLFLSVISFGVCLLTVSMAFVALAIGAPVSAWLIASTIELQFALLFFSVGLIAVQVGLISERTRKTPLVVERERVNFD